MSLDRTPDLAKERKRMSRPLPPPRAPLPFQFPENGAPAPLKRMLRGLIDERKAQERQGR